MLNQICSRTNPLKYFCKMFKNSLNDKLNIFFAQKLIDIFNILMLNRNYNFHINALNKFQKKLPSRKRIPSKRNHMTSHIIKITLKTLKDQIKQLK